MYNSKLWNYSKNIITFLHSDLELGCTSKIKYEIKLDNETPFKDHYHCIPPHQFKEVQKHLQEILDIGTIRYSCSPWQVLLFLSGRRMAVSDSASTLDI